MTKKTLRGLRYQTAGKEWLGDILKNELPYADLAGSMSFYDWLGKNKRITLRDHAFVGCNDRFYLLTRLCNRVDMEHPWTYDRCREVEADPDGYLDLWARYHGKSSICTFAGIIQEVMCDPEITAAIISCTNDVARPFLVQIQQEFENNDVLKAVYSDVLWADPRKEAPLWARDKGIVVKRRGNPKEATIEAFGIIDGMRVGRHYQLLNYEDLVTEKMVTNPEMIKKVTERWELSDNLGTAGKTRKWHEGTRYSFADSYGVMLNERRGGIKPRIYPATDDGTLNGTPVLLTPERWAEVRSTQRSTISAQMLLNPIAGAEQMFRIEWCRAYEVRPSILNVYIMGDPSKGKNKTSDRTAIPVIGIDVNNNKYVLDGYCHRMPQSERWSCLKALYKKWAGMPGVQSIHVGWETYGLQTDHEYFMERMREEKDAPVFEVKELNWVREGLQSKPDRVERLEPEFRNSRFYLPALVWHPDITDPRDGYQHPDKLCTWKIGQSNDLKNKGQVILYTPYREPTKAMKTVTDLGQPYRVAQAIRRVERLGEGEHRTSTIYDVTRVLFEELMFFPFSPRDDLVDATSRYNDLEPSPPQAIEEAAAAAPKIYADT
jgi:hypothetical protein